MIFPETLPKRAGIGTIHLEFKRCGRPTCRCAGGSLHGPYAYRHWRERGRQKKAYVPMERLTAILERLDQQRAEMPKIAEILRMLKEI